MIKLEYDCDLEKYAQAWADGCKFEHSNSWERPNQGQNLYMTTIRNWETSALLHTALEIWWQELEEYGMPSDAILSEEVWAKKGRLIGHFTQMACGKSRRLGCAIATCSDMEYVVCHYSPAGNRKEHAVYEIGSHCKTDYDCPSDFSCIEKEGLHVAVGTSTPQLLAEDQTTL
ncbi:SCP-like protein [Oesophagostomum dentatum]|uniref:SCP-like protein n=1 Tax=Oesophagostomum dentatum TaxID=61180 RepID=A0A0B1STB5_OESDE|nr:SCP-like protein [Oesophagostomum dentatum]